MRLGNYIVLFLFLFSFISIANASLVWKFDAGSPITTQPIIFGNNIVFATENGEIVAVNQQGRLVWRTDVGKFLKQPIVFQDELIVSTSGGKLSMIKKDGAIRLSINMNSTLANLSQVYGLGGGNKIYVTTNKGVVALDKEGTKTIILVINGSMTPPSADSQKIVVGINSTLASLRTNGGVNWMKEIGKTWVSRPYIDGNMIYLGTLDNALYAVDASDGSVSWRMQTEGWIVGDMLVDSGFIYFGSNDGYVYAVNKGSGSVLWKAKTSQAVQSTPVIGTLGGRDVIFAAGTDNSVYAIDRTNGNILAQFSARDWAVGIIYKDGKIIFGSRDGSLYAISDERGCSITEPASGSVVGFKEITVSGMAASSFGNAKVGISINDGPFEDNQLGSNGVWTHTLDPGEMRTGSNILSCRVSDSGGEQSEVYSSILLVRDTNLPKGKFLLTYPKTVIEGGNITIFVSDSETGKPVEFTASFEGRQISSLGNVTVKASSVGVASITISKKGFDDRKITVEVKPEFDIVGIAVPILIAALLLYLFYRFVIKRFLGR